jgi:hypothetical protein
MGLFQHKGREDLGPLANTEHPTIPVCDCGSGLPKDRYDTRYPSHMFCDTCYVHGLDTITHTIEENMRAGACSKRRLSNGDIVDAVYIPRRQAS